MNSSSHKTLGPVYHIFSKHICGAEGKSVLPRPSGMSSRREHIIPDETEKLSESAATVRRGRERGYLTSQHMNYEQRVC